MNRTHLLAESARDNQHSLNERRTVRTWCRRRAVQRRYDHPIRCSPRFSDAAAAAAAVTMSHSDAVMRCAALHVIDAMQNCAVAPWRGHAAVIQAYLPTNRMRNEIPLYDSRRMIHGYSAFYRLSTISDKGRPLAGHLYKLSYVIGWTTVTLHRIKVATSTEYGGSFSIRSSMMRRCMPILRSFWYGILSFSRPSLRGIHGRYSCIFTKTF